MDPKLLGPIYRLTIPVFLSSQLENLIGLADIFMVGRLGVDSMSAVGIATTLTMVIRITMVSVVSGAFTLVAQAVGAGDPRHASSTAKQALTLVAFISLGFGLLGMALSGPALHFLSPTEAVARLGLPYLLVFFAGLVFLALNNVIHNCLYGAGDTRTPFYLGLLSSAVKVVFSYGLIFGAWGLPAQGVVGAATGTVIGQAVGLALGMWALYSGRFALKLLPESSYRPNRDLAHRILKIGVPAGLQGIFRNGSNIVFVKFLALTHNPVAAIAAFTIGNQVERVLRRGSLSFGTAAQTLVGQHIGSGDLARAERYGWTTMAVGPLSMLALGLPMAFWGSAYLGLFTTEAPVLAIGGAYLWALCLAEPFMALAIAAGAGLRGAGETRPTLNYTLVSQWLVRLPASYLLAFTLGFDTDGLWFALVLFSAVQGFLTMRRFGLGVWKTLKV